MMPPPVPVIAPSTTAKAGSTVPDSYALIMPAALKRPRPNASATRSGEPRRWITRGSRSATSEPSDDREEVVGVAKRLRGHAEDRVADHAAAERRREGEDDGADQVGPLRAARRDAAHREARDAEQFEAVEHAPMLASLAMSGADATRARHGGSHRPRQDGAGAGAHRRRLRSPPRREGARHHHRARLRAARPARRRAPLGGRRARSRAAGAHHGRGRVGHRPGAARGRRRRRRDAADARAPGDLRRARPRSRRRRAHQDRPRRRRDRRRRRGRSCATCSDAARSRRRRSCASRRAAARASTRCARDSRRSRPKRRRARRAAACRDSASIASSRCAASAPS